MALSSYVGSFNIDSSITATNTQSVTGVGFQPKIVMFWWSGSNATSDSVAGGYINIGFGVMIDGSNRWACLGASDDAQATTQTLKFLSDAYCVASFPSAVATNLGLADYSSMDADGFTLIIDDQFSVDMRVSFLALGGDDLTNYKVDVVARGGSLGNNSYTGIGFQPDALITATSLQASGYADEGSFCIGMATASDAQGVAAWGSDDNVSTTDAEGYGYNGEINAGFFGGGLGWRDAFVSFDADGFTVNHIENTGLVFAYIALKGGQYLVGDLTTRTDSNDISETVGFQPSAIIFASANRALSTQNTETAHARLSIGAATSASNRAVHAVSDEDNLADSETAYTNQDDAVYAHVIDDAIEALMDIKSIDASGFTCVMDDTETSACWVTYLAIGAAATGTEGPLIGGKLIGDGLLMGGVLVK